MSTYVSFPSLYALTLAKKDLVDRFMRLDKEKGSLEPLFS